MLSNPSAATAAGPSAPLPSPVSRTRAAWALALLLGLQPATTDIYLPALPALTRELGASMSGAQLTMSALILAFGFGQLFWGPVADRVGRRPVLLAGLLLYSAASVGSVLAGSIELLIGWRVLQGATLAAAVVCARAMLRDLYEPKVGAQVMSLGLSGLAVIAIAGPLLGGLVAAAWGWRAALSMVACMGAVTLAFVVLRLPETLAAKNPHATAAGPLLRAWGRIARHPSFVAWTLLVTFTYGGLFTILAGSSFVFIDILGLSPAAYGMAMASASTSYMAGTFVCRRWVAAHGMAGAVKRGAVFTLLGGVLLVAAALAGVQQAWAVLLPQWLFAFGHGVHQPCGQAGAVGPFPQAAGAASALAGFVLAVTAFGIGLWLGRALDGTLLPYALGVGFWSLLTSAVAWTLVQRSAGAGTAA
jgi:DHA1 family bicyclomycin/chloramphenicol resistance-like MFS transporter